jgi:hypothetical protein
LVEEDKKEDKDETRKERRKKKFFSLAQASQPSLFVNIKKGEKKKCKKHKKKTYLNKKNIPTNKK